MLICNQNSFAQSIEVTYAEKKDVSHELETQSNPQVKAILESLAKEEVFYKLQFSNGTSIYSKIESKSEPNESIIRMNDGSYQCYKNQKNSKVIEQNNILNKQFLIHEDLAALEWKILDETETIADYKVKKAVTNINGKKVLVWFTEDIAINDGPRGYWGLPGLILKVVGNGKIIETKNIKVLPNKLTIEEPTEGKSVSREQYDVLKAEKEADIMSGFGGAEVIKINTNN